MDKIDAPIAALFWAGSRNGESNRLALAVRWSVGGPISVRLCPGIYGVFGPSDEPLVFSEPLNTLSGFEFEACRILLFKGTETQATHPVLCPSGALMQPSEVKTAQLSQMFFLAAKESARLESAH